MELYGRQSGLHTRIVDPKFKLDALVQTCCPDKFKRLYSSNFKKIMSGDGFTRTVYLLRTVLRVYHLAREVI